MSRNKAFGVLACALAFATMLGARLSAQAARRDVYFSAEAGLATEPAEFNVRSDRGFALAVGVGRDLSEHFALEARLGGQLFDAPAFFTNPGGCLGRQPCIEPQPSVVHIAALSGDVVWSPSRDGIAPLLIAGAGLRYITEAPQESPELRPMVEIGGEFARSFRTASVGVEGRFQVAVSSAGMPNWTFPFGINIRLF